MARAVLWIIGGPNGAGKTTLASHPRFQRLLHGVRFLNPDQLALGRLRASGRQGFHDATPEELRRCFVEAAETVERELREALAQGQGIGVESVLSTRKYCSLVEHALADKAIFGLIYVALKDSTPGVPPRLIAQGGGGAISILDAEAIPEITRSLAEKPGN